MYRNREDSPPLIRESGSQIASTFGYTPKFATPRQSTPRLANVNTANSISKFGGEGDLRRRDEPYDFRTPIIWGKNLAGQKQLYNKKVLFRPGRRKMIPLTSGVQPKSRFSLDAVEKKEEIDDEDPWGGTVEDFGVDASVKKEVKSEEPEPQSSGNERNSGFGGGAQGSEDVGHREVTNNRFGTKGFSLLKPAGDFGGNRRVSEEKSAQKKEIGVGNDVPEGKSGSGGVGGSSKPNGGGPQQPAVASENSQMSSSFTSQTSFRTGGFAQTPASLTRFGEDVSAQRSFNPGVPRTGGHLVSPNHRLFDNQRKDLQAKETFEQRGGGTGGFGGSVRHEQQLNRGAHDLNNNNNGGSHGYQQNSNAGNRQGGYSASSRSNDGFSNASGRGGYNNNRNRRFSTSSRNSDRSRRDTSISSNNSRGENRGHLQPLPKNCTFGNEVMHPRAAAGLNQFTGNNRGNFRGGRGGQVRQFGARPQPVQQRQWGAPPRGGFSASHQKPGFAGNKTSEAARREQQALLEKRFITIAARKQPGASGCGYLEDLAAGKYTDSEDDEEWGKQYGGFSGRKNTDSTEEMEHVAEAVGKKAKKLEHDNGASGDHQIRHSASSDSGNDGEQPPSGVSSPSGDQTETGVEIKTSSEPVKQDSGHIADPSLKTPSPSVFPPATEDFAPNEPSLLNNLGNNNKKYPFICTGTLFAEPSDDDASEDEPLSHLDKEKSTSEEHKAPSVASFFVGDVDDADEAIEAPTVTPVFEETTASVTLGGDGDVGEIVDRALKAPSPSVLTPASDIFDLDTSVMSISFDTNNSADRSVCNYMPITEPHRGFSTDSASGGQLLTHLDTENRPCEEQGFTGAPVLATFGVGNINAVDEIFEAAVTVLVIEEMPAAAVSADIGELPMANSPPQENAERFEVSSAIRLHDTVCVDIVKKQFPNNWEQVLKLLNR